MNPSRWCWFLLGLLFLQACVASGTSPVFESSGSSEREAVALCPGFRLPRPAKPPALKPVGAPKANSSAADAPAARPSSAEKPSPASAAQAQQKPAAPTPTTRGFLDPKVARELFDQGMAEAKRRFPHLYGKPMQQHHVHPRYLGGPEDGPTVDLDPAYHQLITSTFRERYAYGQRVPKLNELQDILRYVYTKYPLPGIHF
jgi:hypothetical protein